jgi:MarR family 2-MHQ and catechol resistance regulon transcriptional repressor
MAEAEETSGTRLWLVLARAYRALADYIEASVLSLGIGLSDFAILEALLHKGPLAMSVIAEKVLLANASTTSAIDRLEERGLVQRQPHPTDRRIRIVNLTCDGAALIRTLFAQHELDIEAIMAPLGPEERNQLRQGLKTIGYSARHALGALHAPAGGSRCGEHGDAA